MEDDVVEQGDVEKPHCVLDVLGECDVSLTGLYRTRRMVVADDECGRLKQQGFLGDEPHVNRGGSEPSFADLFRVQNAGRLIEEDDPKLLVPKVTDALLHDFQHIRGRVDVSSAFDALRADSMP